MKSLAEWFDLQGFWVRFLAGALLKIKFNIEKYFSILVRVWVSLNLAQNNRVINICLDNLRIKLIILLSANLSKLFNYSERKLKSIN